MADIDMNKLLDLNTVAAIRDWALATFAQGGGGSPRWEPVTTYDFANDPIGWTATAVGALQ